MAFEELPTEYAEFFNSGGELPAALLAEHKPVTPPPVAEVVKPVVAAVDTETKVETPAPAPVAPTSNPYAEQLLQEKENQLTALQKQIAELQGKIDKATETPPPDKTLDPLGYMTHMTEKLEAQLAAMKAEQ